jgi:hypothetical protein
LGQRRFVSTVRSLAEAAKEPGAQASLGPSIGMDAGGFVMIADE